MDSDVKKCAQAHSDKSCIKQILECAQLMSTALHICKYPNPPYKLTHQNHPDSIYTRKSQGNYKYVLSLFEHLIQEYFERYGKIHACSKLYDTFFLGIGYIPAGDFEEPPQCMPDEYKIANNTVQSYRNYYMKEKAYYCKWRNGNIPEWFSLK